MLPAVLVREVHSVLLLATHWTKSCDCRFFQPTDMANKSDSNVVVSLAAHSLAACASIRLHHNLDNCFMPFLWFLMSFPRGLMCRITYFGIAICHLRGHSAIQQGLEIRWRAVVYCANKQDIFKTEHLSDIEALRASFIEVSKSMIAIAESFVPISTTVYVQHCPMADSNKGADWLSNKEEILNPYFGQAMLSCGENTKTIK